MDDDLFQFEQAPEAAPQLVLGKKKKKKKKKKDDDNATDDQPDAQLSTDPDNLNPDESGLPPLNLGKSKTKKSEKASASNGHTSQSSTFAALDEYGNNERDEDQGEQSSTQPPQSAFAALDLDDNALDAEEDDAIAPVALGTKKKKKKKKALNLDPIEPPNDSEPVLEIHPEVDDNSGEEQKRPMTAAEKKKAKKERERQAKAQAAKAENDDFDAILAELGDSSEQTAVKPATGADKSLPLTAAAKKRMKKKKKGAAAKTGGGADDEEVDALLAELAAPSDTVEEANPPETAAGAAVSGEGIDDLLAELTGDASSSKKKSKKKKKGTAVVAVEEPPAGEDINALLDSLATGDDSKESGGDTGAQVAGDDVDELMAELAGDATTSKAKAKRKKKKKAGAKADEADGGAEDAEAEASAPSEKGKKKKKESAAIRMMREQREKALAEEERLRKLEEEEEARVAAEEQRLADEAKKKEEQKAKKKASEKAKRERKRQEGTLYSKAEKERRRKAEAFRKQLEEKGMIPGAMSSQGTSQLPNPPPRPDRGPHNRKRRNQKDSLEKKDAEPIAGSAPQTGIGEAPPKDDAAPREITETESPIEEKVIPEAWDADDDHEDKEQEESASQTVGKSESDPKPKRTATSTVISSRSSKTNDPNPSDDSESEEDDSEDESDDSDYDGMSKTEIAAEKRLEVFRKQRAKQKETALAARTADQLRSPVICILGHVDTGKTKILDKIRRTNVQDGEAGGITQQIGATYFPIDAVKKEAIKLKQGRELSYNVPSLLIIDTPGHESFTNLRSRGSSLCDIAILVVDIMHGLEPQTRESIDLLKLRKTPFIVALNKIDRIYDWKAQPNNCPSRDSLDLQPSHSRDEFHRRVREIKLEFAQIGFNTELYWDNKDVRKTVSIVPTSAITGEGIPDLLMLLLALPQKLLTERLMFTPWLEATVLEVKVIEGLGTTIDIILTGGTIREGETIMVVGLDGPITATIRALLTPHPMKEMRVKGQYLHHKEIQAAQGVKISADGLEKAVAGTQLMVVRDPNNEDEVEYVREEVMKDFQTILTNVDKSGLGVYVQASTLGSLEALLEFLKTSKIPVSGINIGPVHKRDVTKASTMLERRKEYSTILAFDVIVEKEARELAEEVGVKIFTADIIYHLFDQFTLYMEDMKKLRREQVNDDVVFPSISKILPQHIYNKKDPIVVGVDVMEGILRVGTPLVVKKPDGAWLDVGKVASIELNKKQVVTAKKGESVAVKIQHKSTEHIMYGRHFDFQDALISKMSRSAIELLKENFKGDLEKDDWRLVVKLRDMFKII